MTREHAPCGSCARFKPGKPTGHCEGFDRPAYSTDQPCVLFNERGAWKTRKSEQVQKMKGRP